jgi:hypothetical protein
MKMDEGFHSTEQARKARAAPGYKPTKRLSDYERLATPPEFRDVLIDIARGCRP